MRSEGAKAKGGRGIWWLSLPWKLHINMYCQDHAHPPAKQYKFKELSYTIFPDLVPLRGVWFSFSWSRMRSENLNQTDWAGGVRDREPLGADGKG